MNERVSKIVKSLPLIAITATPLAIPLSGVPEWWAPWPIWMFILVLLGLGTAESVGGPAYILAALVIFAVPALLYFLIASHRAMLRWGGAVKTLALITMLGGLHVWYVVPLWHSGLRWNSPQHTYSVIIISSAYLAALSVPAAANLRAKNLIRDRTLRILAVFWFCWFAFPYLGELP